MKLKVFSMLMIGAVAFANAQDKSLLETLVKKGTITEQEAAQIAKDSVVVTPGTSDTKKLTINGGVDIRYDFGNYKVKSPSPQYPGTTPQRPNDKTNANGFDLRYAKLGIAAEIQGGWMVDFTADFGVEGRNRNYLDKVVISKKIAFDYLTGTLDVGLRKVNMGLEQGLDDFALYTPERSVTTSFFTRPDRYVGEGTKNFGSRAIGVFWSGTVEQVRGLYYGASVVGGNSFEGSAAELSNVEGNNNLSFYINVGYTGKQAIKNESFTYDIGLNLGYANGGYVIDGEKNEIYGFNPYVSVNWRGLNFMAEYFLQSVQDGKFTSRDRATPMGFNITLAYKFDLGEFGVVEPVFRASMLASDGMGFDPVTLNSYGSLNAFNPDDTMVNLFDRAQTYYIGANWYVVPSVKIGVGYEWGEYSKGDRVGGSSANRAESNMVRAQLQVLF